MLSCYNEVKPSLRGSHVEIDEPSATNTFPNTSAEELSETVSSMFSVTSFEGSMTKTPPLALTSPMKKGVKRTVKKRVNNAFLKSF